MSIVFGAGGVAGEVSWIIDSMIREGTDVSPVEAYVVPDTEWESGMSFDALPVLTETEAVKRFADRSEEAFLAVGLPLVRRKVYAKITAGGNWRFPQLVSPDASMDRRPGRVRLGEGAVIYPRASLTTDITLGDFVQVNPGATIAHECVVDAFTTICPGAHLSGGVSIGSDCFIGAGAVIRQDVHVAAGCVIGAGCVVVSSIRESGTWVGVPARKLES